MEPHITSHESGASPNTGSRIVMTPGVCGGKPRIAGTRIRVQDIYIWHEVQGQSVDEIVSNFPHLSMGEVHAALAYFWDHSDEILLQMKEAEALVEDMKRIYPSVLSQKLAQHNAPDDPISPR